MKYLNPDFMPAKKRVFVLLFSILFLAYSGLIHASESENVFGAADQFYVARSDYANALAALKLYRELFRERPQDYNAAWRLSMAAYFAGFNIEKNPAAQKKLFAEGKTAGFQALALNPDGAEGHFWTAVNMALYGQSVGTLKMLFTVGSIKAHLRQVIKQDPSYARAGSFRILGAIDEALPAVLGGSNERARDLYIQSIEIVPDEPMNYLFLARIYLKKFSDKNNAVKTSQTGLSIPNERLLEYESQKAKLELEEFSKKELLGR